MVKRKSTSIRAFNALIVLLSLFIGCNNQNFENLKSKDIDDCETLNDIYMKYYQATFDKGDTLRIRRPVSNDNLYILPCIELVDWEYVPSRDFELIGVLIDTNVKALQYQQTPPL